MQRFAVLAVLLLACFVGTEAKAQVLTQSGTCPGVMTFEVTGALPFSRIGYIHSGSLGSWVVPPGQPCPGLTTALAWPVVLAVFEEADAFGFASVSGFVPPGFCNNRYVQAVDTLACTPTNWVLIP